MELLTIRLESTVPKYTGNRKNVKHNLYHLENAVVARKYYAKCSAYELHPRRGLLDGRLFLLDLLLVSYANFLKVDYVLLELSLMFTLLSLKNHA